MAATFWLYSHNFTHSGAPLVLAAIARELGVSGWRKQLRVISWGGLHDRRYSSLHKELLDEGIFSRIKVLKNLKKSNDLKDTIEFIVNREK